MSDGRMVRKYVINGFYREVVVANVDGTTWSVSRVHNVGKDVEEVVGRLIVILPRNLPTGTEENHEEAQDSQCPCRDPNQTLIGYEFRAVPLG
jgi:hypothetical protein